MPLHIDVCTAHCDRVGIHAIILCYILLYIQLLMRGDGLLVWPCFFFSVPAPLRTVFQLRVQCIRRKRRRIAYLIILTCSSLCNAQCAQHIDRHSFAGKGHGTARHCGCSAVYLDPEGCLVKALLPGQRIPQCQCCQPCVCIKVRRIMKSIASIRIRL